MPRSGCRDGSAQQMGGCLRDFRNRPYAVRMRVVYQKRTLTVSDDNTNIAIEQFDNIAVKLFLSAHDCIGT